MEQMNKKNPFTDFYAFTISPHQRHAPLLTSVKAVRNLFYQYKSCMSAVYIIETSSKGKIHVHGIVALPHESKWVKLRKHPTVKYHMVKIHEPIGWIEYILKEKPKRIYSCKYSFPNGRKLDIVDEINGLKDMQYIKA